MQRPPFGAILAGGRNTRYGDLKAFAPVGGQPIIERVAAALRAVTPDLIVIANEPAAYSALNIPLRSDRISGIGALGGLQSALQWAAEEQRPGVLVVACDMPFVSSPLLRVLLQRAQLPNEPDLVIPESAGPRGVEPLCAYYSTRCLPAIDRAISCGEVHMTSFHNDVTAERLALSEVLNYGDPEWLFLNVNTMAERERAERHAREAQA